MGNHFMLNSQPKKWTIMVYLAGDNDLEGFGPKDLNEMKTIGSTNEVAILAQFDRRSDQITRRYHLTANGSLDNDCVAELPEINCGDPKALIDFFTWARQQQPAEHYALVLWNHGRGWKDDDIYQIAKSRGIADDITRGVTRGLLSSRKSRALFRPSMEVLIEAARRGILYDDSSADFLDSVELRNVLATINTELGRPLDLLGCDACLMSMVEVGYQVRDLCRVMVGSQEVEPGDGWPYHLILRRLVTQPKIEATILGQVIVESYVDYYRSMAPNLSITQSAIDLACLKPVAELVSKLGEAFEAKLVDDATLGSLYRILRSVQKFTDRDYVDLMHFCQLIANAFPTDVIGNNAASVVNYLEGQQTPIVAEGHNGPSVANATGLSIHLSARTLSPLYERLEFAKDGHWDDFLNAFCPC